MPSTRPYAEQAKSLNAGQKQAYDAKGHCVVLAGPGSGKTKTLTLKIARLLSEEIQEPRGLACITYNNEGARELEQRLTALGIEPSKRLLVGTVHSFCLTQILIPHAASLDLGLPPEFKVATKAEQSAALETAYASAIGPGNPHVWKDRVGKYRRTILDRESEAWRTTDERTAALVEAYETELHGRGLIDFDDMPLMGLRALRAHAWLRLSLVAKYPVLAVDEYQDLGKALHAMVVGLCFYSGMRLFAVGDPDQSIYGFVGSDPALLRDLAKRPDVEPVGLKLNYRCAKGIVSASELALGEVRGYSAPDSAPQGTIFFHPLTGSYEHQAITLFGDILSDLGRRRPELELGDIAILYPAAFIGDAVADLAQRLNAPVIRTDTNSLYPRGSRLLSWIERCAVWCSSGWQAADPRLSQLLATGLSLFGEGLRTDEERIVYSRVFVSFLWNSRDGAAKLHNWLLDFETKVMSPMASSTPRLDDERESFAELLERTGPSGEAADLNLNGFVGGGASKQRLNLSTLHSAKGREFEVVVMFGIDEGRLPRKDADLREARQLFYVGLTRAKTELHIVSSARSSSRFVTELEGRLK